MLPTITHFSSRLLASIAIEVEMIQHKTFGMISNNLLVLSGDRIATIANQRAVQGEGSLCNKACMLIERKQKASYGPDGNLIENTWRASGGKEKSC
jgi:hypothetical protein